MLEKKIIKAAATWIGKPNRWRYTDELSGIFMHKAMAAAAATAAAQIDHKQPNELAKIDKSVTSAGTTLLHDHIASHSTAVCFWQEHTQLNINTTTLHKWTATCLSIYL